MRLKRQERMLKMGGFEKYFKEGSILKGNHGEYRLKKSIGSGGNGVVFGANAIKMETSQVSEEIVIKGFKHGSWHGREEQKREQRFIKEIIDVQKIQESVDGILPIYDSVVLNGRSKKPLWYVMPRADRFQTTNYSTLEKLEHMRNLAVCIEKMHSLGYAHRDIKPRNLLLLNGKICLSDFGLIWNCEDQDINITEVNDRIGPLIIRPPEMQPILNVRGMDYRASDVYLFAKTMWMVLNSDSTGFQFEYNRGIEEICFDKEKLGLITVEPLHEMMEGATKNEYFERIGIDDCINYINNQIDIIKGKATSEDVRAWKYAEQFSTVLNVIPCDKRTYSNPITIQKILNALDDKYTIEIDDTGRTICLQLLHLKPAEENTYVMSIDYLGRRKDLIIAVKEIHIEEKQKYEIVLHKNYFDENRVPCYNSINRALKAEGKRVYLNEGYVITISG